MLPRQGGGKGGGERRTRRGGEEEAGTEAELEVRRGGVLVKEKGGGKRGVRELEECHNSLQIGEADVQSLTWPCTVPFEVWSRRVYICVCVCGKCGIMLIAISVSTRPFVNVLIRYRYDKHGAMGRLDSAVSESLTAVL